MFWAGLGGIAVFGKGRTVVGEDAREGLLVETFRREI